MTQSYNNMPAIVDNERIDDLFIDGRSKLLPCQREMVLYHRALGASQRDLAKIFKVSRRLITFVLNPEALVQNKARREQRGGSSQYYDKEKNTASAKKHRAKKKSIKLKYDDN